MSRITDALDQLEVTVPRQPPTGLVATNRELAAAAGAAYAAGLGMASAVAAAFPEGPVEVLGFSSATAEPFACAPSTAGALRDVLHARLTLREPVEGTSEPLWGTHRGHAVFLYPNLAGARACLALRLAEVLGTRHALAVYREGLLAVTAGLESVAELEAALQDASIDALVEALDARSSRVTTVPTGLEPAASVHPLPEALVLLDGVGGTVVARRPSPAPLAIVERAGRPFVVSLDVSELGELFDLLGAVIDRDEPAALSTSRAAIRVEPSGSPELVGPEGATMLVDQSTSDQP